MFKYMEWYEKLFFGSIAFVCISLTAYVAYTLLIESPALHASGKAGNHNDALAWCDRFGSSYPIVDCLATFNLEVSEQAE